MLFSKKTKQRVNPGVDASAHSVERHRRYVGLSAQQGHTLIRLDQHETARLVLRAPLRQRRDGRNFIAAAA